MTRFAWLAVFALAALVRGFYLFEMRDSPLFHVVMGDGLSYERWAQQIVAGDWLGKEIFYQAPMYPYFLAAVHFILGPDIAGVRLVQLLLGSASCVMLGKAGERFFDRRTGIVAGVLLALYGPFIFYEGLIQKPVLDVFFTCALLLLASLATRWWTALLMGLVLALLTLTRENALVFVPVLAAWVWFARDLKSAVAQPPLPSGEGRGEGRSNPTPQPSAAAPAKRALHLAAFLLGLTTILGLVALRNHAVGGEFILTTAQMGPNFYIGNHHGAPGTYRPLIPGRGDPRYERSDATHLAEQATGKKLSPAEVSSYWMNKSFSEISDNFRAWLRLMGRKIALVINAREVIDFESIEASAEDSAILALLWRVMHLGVVGPIAVAGIWLTRKRWRELWLLYALALSMAAATAAFYVVGRYRVTIVPELALFAAAALCALPRMKMSQRAAMIGIALVATIAFNWPMPASADPRAVTRQNVGLSLEAEGDFAGAEAQFRRVLALYPNQPAAHKHLGNVLLAQEKFDEAISHYLKCLELQPNLPDVNTQVGRMIASRGALTQAMVFWRRALAAQPDYMPALDAMARALATHSDPAQRNPQEMVTLARRAVEVTQGKNPRPLLTLAEALHATGDRGGAIWTAEQALSAARAAGDAQYAQVIEQQLSRMRSE